MDHFARLVYLRTIAVQPPPPSTSMDGQAAAAAAAAAAAVAAANANAGQPPNNPTGAEAISEWPPPLGPPQQQQQQPQQQQQQQQQNQQQQQQQQLMPAKKSKKRPREYTAESEDESEFLFADAALATWWRREGRWKMDDYNDLPRNCSPNTLINFIGRTKAGQQFLRLHLAKLDGLRHTKKKSNGRLHVAVATAWERLGDYHKARDLLQAAVRLCPEENEYQWLLCKVQRQLYMLESQAAAMERLPEQSQRVYPTPGQIERRRARDLSIAEFVAKYCEAGVPVIITDIVETMTRQPWDLNHINQVAGLCRVVLKRLVNLSVEWAKLELAKESTVAEFIQSLKHPGRDADHESLYLFDWSLPIHCPQLAQEVTIPHYFRDNFLTHTPEGSLYQNSWPSLFIAPAGMVSELHIDTHGTSFWMALLHGRKRWTIFHKSDTPFLYPFYPHSMDPVFEADLTCPNLNTHPLLSLTSPRECVLQPGELLFVPARCPHRVENLDTTIAISGNFVNKANLRAAMEELEVSALVDPPAHQLLRHLQEISRAISTPTPASRIAHTLQTFQTTDSRDFMPSFTQQTNR
ncbi:hypothetical protein CHUAL_006226 [Chamberlinius hualienensis]